MPVAFWVWVWTGWQLLCQRWHTCLNWPDNKRPVSACVCVCPGILWEHRKVSLFFLLSLFCRIEKEIEALEREEMNISTNEGLILKRLKAIEKSPEEIIKVWKDTERNYFLCAQFFYNIIIYYKIIITRLSEILYFDQSWHSKVLFFDNNHWKIMDIQILRVMLTCALRYFYTTNK